MVRLRVLLFAATVSVLSVVVAFSSAAFGGPHGAEKRGVPEAIERRIKDIFGERDDLAREGIFLQAVGWTGKCVFIQLANPTRPNVEYLRRRYDGACVSRKPLGPLVACPGYAPSAVPFGEVVVPDLRNLGLYAAERGIVARGLTYAYDCAGDREKEAKRPPSDSIERLVRITAQCPRPGVRVPPGTEVALDAAAVLPGGFVWRDGVLRHGYECADGRSLKPEEARRRRDSSP